MTDEKPYRFVLTLNQETRRKLALLQVDALSISGRLPKAADVVRDLINGAPLKGTPSPEGLTL